MINMPHSVTPEATVTTVTMDGEMEAESRVESQVSDVTMAGEVQNGESQESTAEEDMTMADVNVEEDEQPKPTTTNPSNISEVKLEDLFADIDSDEEFPSSAPGIKAEGSPEAPASPMYV